MKIDEVDVRILKTLLRNVRTSFSEIAKDCGMSSNAIRIRFERLKKNGVITGSRMQVNPKTLGYNCVALLKIKAAANEQTEVYDFVHKIPNVIACFQPIGRYNIHCFVASKNIDELAHTVEQVSSHPNVFDVKECIWVDVIKMDHPENLAIIPSNQLDNTHKLLSENEKHKATTAPSHLEKEGKENGLEESYELGKTDLLIAKVLSDNASISFRKIAKKLGISTQYAIKRYKRMRKTVLPFSSITVNLKKLGYIGVALFSVKTSHKHTTSKVFNEILRIPNVTVAIKCVGAIDMHLAVPFSNIKQLTEVKQRICNTPGVKEIELFIEEPFPSWPLNLFAQLLPNQSQTS